MNKIASKLLSIFFIFFVFFTSCEKYPIDALLGLSGPIGAWPDIWYVYDDQFNTKGNPEPYVFDNDSNGVLNPYCDSWDNVTLTANCTESPQSGTKCIKFTWTGNSNNSGKTFFSFGMQSRNEMGGTIDLTNSGYKYLKFYVKGTLYNNCLFQIEIPGSYCGCILPNSEIEVTSNWQEVVVDMQDFVSYMGNLEYVIALSLKAEGGVTNGGTVYIDNIRFTKDY